MGWVWFAFGFVAGFASLGGWVLFKLQRVGDELVGPQ